MAGDTFCPCGARVERYPDLDGISVTVERSKAGELTFAAIVDGVPRVAEYLAEEDDGTDIRLKRHEHATEAAA